MLCQGRLQCSGWLFPSSTGRALSQCIDKLKIHFVDAIDANNGHYFLTDGPKYLIPQMHNQSLSSITNSYVLHNILQSSVSVCVITIRNSVDSIRQNVAMSMQRHSVAHHIANSECSTMYSIICGRTVSFIERIVYHFDMLYVRVKTFDICYKCIFSK